MLLCGWFYPWHLGTRLSNQPRGMASKKQILHFLWCQLPPIIIRHSCTTARSRDKQCLYPQRDLWITKDPKAPCHSYEELSSRKLCVPHNVALDMETALPGVGIWVFPCYLEYINPEEHLLVPTPNRSRLQPLLQPQMSKLQRSGLVALSMGSDIFPLSSLVCSFSLTIFLINSLIFFTVL